MEELENEERKREKGKAIIIEEEEEIFPRKGNTNLVIKETANTLAEDIYSIQVKNPDARRILNGLFNFDVYFEIPGVERFKIQAILDTGASSCCINIDAVPKEAVEPSMYSIQINGVNSQQIANQKLKGGQMSIEENKFRIPFTYAFPMKQKDGIQMLIGCNFIRAMQGGLRIEGQTMHDFRSLKMESQRPAVRRAASLAERWATLGGESIELGMYFDITDDLVNWRIGQGSISVAEDTNLRGQLTDLFKEQARQVCVHLEILVAMSFLQKARHESFATRDNWSRDCLGIVDDNIQQLIKCHNTISRIHRGFHH